MSLIEQITNNPEVIGQLSQKFGFDPAMVQNLVQQIAPTLVSGLHSSLSKDGPAAEALQNAVVNNDHADLLTNPEQIASDRPQAHSLVGHLLGDKAESLADDVAQDTGVAPSTLKQMLPTLAALVVGAASQAMSSGGGIRGVLSSIEQNPQTSNLLGDLLGAFRRNVA